MLPRKSNLLLVPLDGPLVVDDALVVLFGGALVMHCLPAYRGKEIDEPTLEAHADTIFTQAENRLHAQKAILNWLVRRKGTLGLKTNRLNGGC